MAVIRDILTLAEEIRKKSRLAWKQRQSHIHSACEGETIDYEHAWRSCHHLEGEVMGLLRAMEIVSEGSAFAYEEQIQEKIRVWGEPRAKEKSGKEA